MHRPVRPRLEPVVAVAADKTTSAPEPVAAVTTPQQGADMQRGGNGNTVTTAPDINVRSRG